MFAFLGFWIERSDGIPMAFADYIIYFGGWLFVISGVVLLIIMCTKGFWVRIL